MAMNPRLLRPLASGKNPETLDWITAVYAAGSSVNTATANAVDEFVSGCKSDGIWDAIKACCVLCGPDTLAGALVPLVGTAPTNNNFVAGDYNRLTGLVGDGSTKYLDSNRNNNADPQDDKHFSVYLSESIAATQNFFGALPSTGTGRSTFDYTSGNVRAFVNTHPNPVNFAGPVSGFLGANRSSSASFVARNGGSTVTASEASQTPYDGNLFVFTRNLSGSPSGYSATRIAFYSIGEALDLEALDTRVSALITAIGNS